MDAVKLIKKGIKRPHRIPWFLNRMFKFRIHHRINRAFYRRLGLWDYNQRGVDIIEADWDNLLILDACRADMIDTDQEFPGEFNTITSRASNTTEWLKANFNDRELMDTVYVTASPMHVRRREQLNFSFYDVIDIWNSDEWNEEYNTVLPETVVKYAKEAADDYPNKRLLIHFVQPHYPFLSSKIEADKVRPDPDAPPFWSRLTYDEIDLDADIVWEAYIESLERTLPHVWDLVESLPGKSVVSADHGNMVGERGFPLPVKYWGHPTGIYTDSLVEVPWIEYTNGERKEIKEGTGKKQYKSADKKEVDKRLRDLGYK